MGSPCAWAAIKSALQVSKDFINALIGRMGICLLCFFKAATSGHFSYVAQKIPHFRGGWTVFCISQVSGFLLSEVIDEGRKIGCMMALGRAMGSFWKHKNLTSTA